jgi:hypothetical protein
MSSIPISVALRPLRVKSGRLVVVRFGPFSSLFSRNEAPHNGAPYQSISVNFILLDSPYRKEYRYGLVISPFSTGEKEEAMSRTHPPQLFAARMHILWTEITRIRLSKEYVANITCVRLCLGALLMLTVISEAAGKR